MEIFLQILFWTSVAAIFHSYVLFPIILKILAKNKSANSKIFKLNENLPSVSIILASYNEEDHIEKKIISTFETDYPLEKIEFLIGSDNSSDKTNDIIEQYSKDYKQIKFYDFKFRQGKIKIINKLKEEAENELLIFTDTKVFFRKDTIFNLIKHFKNNEIGIVGGILNNSKIETTGVYIQEDAYMNREMKIKYDEGVVWGCSMGVFGAVYAIKPELYNHVPENFKVDDFYITMKVLSDNKKVIFSKDAISDEILTGNIKEEFKRKVRISTGNFQNLKVFLLSLFHFWKPYSFSFLSHKVIRWIGPFLLVIIFLSLLFLNNLLIYKIFLGLFVFSMILPFIDFLLSKININIIILRFITHFYSMNIALALGFFKFLTGVKSAVWEPSKRS